MTLPDARKLNKVSSENHKVFQQILKKCSEQIKYDSIKLNRTNMIFQVPTILPDFSDYNFHHCISYLEKKLKDSHYQVKINQNILLVSWSNVKSSKKKETDNEFASLYELKRKFPQAKLEYTVNN
jgi:hypothetical protein